MGKEQSFLRNVLNGIQLRIRNIIFQDNKGYGVGRLKKIYLKHLPPNKIHHYNLGGKKTYFYGGPEMLHGINEIFVEGIYNQTLPENAFIIDCGAHIGLSVIFFKSICSSAEIICFEPDSKNFELLTRNIKSHDLKNIRPIKKATWIANTTIYFTEEGNMSSRITSDINGGNSVNASRLYDYLDRKVDFLKIDIEGAEYQVLKDISGRLSNVDRLFIEYHGLFSQNEELLEMLQIISKSGFSFYIKEAAPVYKVPFSLNRDFGIYDLQLNIFCIRNS